MDSKKDEKYLNTAMVIKSCSECLETVFCRGPLPVWLPVVISCTRIIFHIESKFKLPVSANEIIRCNSDINIYECKLLDTGNCNAGKIFFSGYIKESIEFSEYSDSNTDEAAKKVRFTSVKLPFDCFSDIEYYFPPRCKKNGKIHPVELNAGIFTMENGIKYEGKYDNPDFLQCELLDIKVQDTGFKQFGQGEVNGHLIVSISFLLTQKQLINI